VSTPSIAPRSPSVKFETKEWSVHVDQSVIDSSLSDQAFHLLLVLESYARLKSVCWPSNDDLCKRTGKCRKAIAGALHELETAGWIELEYKDPETKRNRSRIRLLSRTGSMAEKRHRDGGILPLREQESAIDDGRKSPQKYSPGNKTERRNPAGRSIDRQAIALPSSEATKAPPPSMQNYNPPAPRVDPPDLLTPEQQSAMIAAALRR